MTDRTPLERVNRLRAEVNDVAPGWEIDEDNYLAIATLRMVRMHGSRPAWDDSKFEVNCPNNATVYHLHRFARPDAAGKVLDLLTVIFDHHTPDWYVDDNGLAETRCSQDGHRWPCDDNNQALAVLDQLDGGSNQ